MIETKMFDKLKNSLIYVFFQRVENSVDLGTPDVCYAFDGICGWIELKQAKAKPRIKWTVPFRNGQYAWYKRYHRTGAPYFLGVTLGDDWYMIPGSKVKESYLMHEMEEFFICTQSDLRASEDLFIAALRRR